MTLTITLDNKTWSIPVRPSRKEDISLEIMSMVHRYNKPPQIEYEEKEEE